MAGHSKWNNIKNKKGKTDAQKAKIFTKIGREIAIAVKDGGPDPDSNSRLRDVIAKAKASNMPNDNISRSIKKASGEGGNINYEEIIYEGYGPNGIAIIVEAATDNKNRTAGEIRYIFDRGGGAMGTTGSVGWMFDTKGVIYVSKKDGMDDDEFMLEAIEMGAEDIQPDEEGYTVFTEQTDFAAVREAIREAGFEIVIAELDRIPQNTIIPDDEDAIAELIEKFEDNDDVQNVYHNAEISE